MLIKPEEKVLFRAPSSGGLGLVSVKVKSQAFLTRNFLELAIIPLHQKSHYMSMLFRFYVLNDDIPCLSMPPFYNTNFFLTIRSALEKDYDIETMKVKDWYSFITLELGSDEGPSKVEAKSPDILWPKVWENA